MIVYGTRAVLQKTEYIYDACPNCRAANSVLINVYQRYAHVFWIPFFPIGKTGISACKGCSQVLKLNQMPESLKLNYENIKSNTRIPVWTFIGVFLIGAGIIAGVVSENQKAEKVGKLLLAPKKNDVFQIKLKDDQYTLYKVQKVERDTVYFVANKFVTDQESGISELTDKGDQAFDESTTYGISIPKLVEMNNSDKIVDIDRK